MLKISSVLAIPVPAMVLTFAGVNSVLADVPPPARSEGIDWLYIISGVVCGLVGALIFVWIGRKFSKR